LLFSQPAKLVVATGQVNCRLILGNLTAETDANGHQTKYEYDGVKRRMAVIRPMGQRSTTAYDLVGNMISSTDFNGQTTTYAYDRNYLLVGKQFADGSRTSATYTATGKRQTVTDDRGTTTYAYNVSGQISSVTNPDGQRISYTYDSQGHLASITTMAGTTSYTYGASNRLQQVTDSQGGSTAYTYDVAGNLVSTQLANGIRETRGYDLLGRVVSVTNTNAQGALVSGYTYTLDAIGNKTKVVESNGRQVEYGYDVRNRLTSEQITDLTNGNRAISYAYDAVGNRLSVSDSVAGTTTYSYNDNDWLISQTHGGRQTQYTYDSNGSVLSKFQSASDRTTYTWNLDHRLAEVQVVSGTETHRSTYAYDADGNRVRQTVDGASTHYLLDVNRGLSQVAAEYNSQGVQASYTYAGGIISQVKGSTTSYNINDGHSGVRFITSNTGAVTDAYNYDGYGNLLQSLGDNGSDLYRGEPRDAKTGLHYLRARYYDSSSGRFLSTDPFEGLQESPISRHRYLYGNTNPITYSDPSGNFAISLPTVNAISTIVQILAGATIVQAGIGTIANLSGDIEWAGTFSSIGAKGTVGGVYIGAGGSILDLTTISGEEKSQYIYPGFTGNFRGKWLQVYGSAGLELLDPFKAISPNSLSLNSKVKAYSPRIIQATPVAFMGAFAYGSIISDRGSGKIFNAGFGYGYSTSLFSSSSMDTIAKYRTKNVSLPVTGFQRIRGSEKCDADGLNQPERCFSLFVHAF
jgi:RHS repeat-associated protein